MRREYQEVAPQVSLREYIKCFWMLERDFQSINGALDVLPDSYVDVIFNIGSACWVDDGATFRELPTCYAVTLLEKPFQLQTTGVLRTIGIRFFAWGFYPLMGINLPPDQTIHRLDGAWERLKDRLIAVQADQAFDVLQDGLLECLPHDAANPALGSNASHQLAAWKGDLKVNELAEHVHLSPRQLERQFRERVRIAPKSLARKLRFEKARDHLSRNLDADFAQLALDCGYADQAHLSREFKYFSRRTLRQFVAEIRNVDEDLRFGVGFANGS